MPPSVALVTQEAAMALVSFRGSFPAFQSSRNVSALKKVYPKSKRHSFSPIFRTFRSLYVVSWCVNGVNMIDAKCSGKKVAGAIMSSVESCSLSFLALFSLERKEEESRLHSETLARPRTSCIYNTPSNGVEDFSQIKTIFLLFWLMVSLPFCVHPLSGVKWTACRRWRKEGWEWDWFLDNLHDITLGDVFVCQGVFTLVQLVLWNLFTNETSANIDNLYWDDKWKPRVCMALFQCDCPLTHSAVAD